MTAYTEKQYVEEMIATRRKIHQTPEEGWTEFQTTWLVVERLRALGLKVLLGTQVINPKAVMGRDPKLVEAAVKRALAAGVPQSFIDETGGYTGAVAVLETGRLGPVTAFRSDMDCVLVTESDSPDHLPTACGFSSKRPGFMHACGHDGHMTILLGAMTLLAESKNFNGTVRAIFQPAEEPGKGAKAMIDDGLFEKYPVDEIYGLHNIPFLPEGEIHTRPGGIMASEDNFTIKIHGRGGHASSPHVGIDPLIPAAQIILGLQTIVSRNANPLEPAVVSVTELHTDGAHNAIPSNIVMTGDTRSTSPEMQALIEIRMRTIVEHACAMAGAASEFSYTHEFAPTVNWPECAAHAAAAARKAVGADKVKENCQPVMISEDFGKFLTKVPGCFVFLGSGKKDRQNYMLHNAQFDYNDDVILTGVKFFKTLVEDRLAV